MNQNNLNSQPNPVPVNNLEDNPNPEVLTSPEKPLLEPEIVSPPRKSFLPGLLVLLLLSCASLVFAYSYRSRMSKTPDVITPTPKPFFLTVDNLDEPTIALDGELLIKGSTLPNTTVMIYSDLDETSLESDNQGNFQDTIVIDEEAGGLVRITAYSSDGQEKTTTLDVLNGQNESDDSVLGKTDSKANNGKSNKDNLNDETTVSNNGKSNPNGGNNTLTTLETTDEEDKEVKVDRVNPNKPIVDLLIPTKSKNIKADLEVKLKAEKSPKPEAVIDFLTDQTEIKKPTKLGTKKMLQLLSEESSASATLSAQFRVREMEAVAATKGAQLNRHAISGVITNLTDVIITISHQIQTERINTIYFNSSTIVNIKNVLSATGIDLMVGMRIAAVGIPSEDGILASRIHVIPGKATGVFYKYPDSEKTSSDSGDLDSDEATPSAEPSPEAIDSASPTAEPTPEASESADPTTTPEPITEN